MKRIGHIIGLVTLALAGALFACDLEIVGDLTPNECKKSSDCDGAVCSDRGYCVSVEIEPIEIAYEITPGPFTTPWEGAPLLVQFPVETVSHSGITDFDLPELTHVFGRVRLGSSTVPALVTVEDAEVIPGVSPASVQAQAQYAAPASDGGDADYGLYFARGRTVRVRVTPVGVPLSAPPDLRTFGGDVVLPPLETVVELTGTSMRVDLTYPTDIFAACTSVRQSSCALTLQFEKAAGSGTLLDLEDLSVQAVTSEGDVISSYGRIENGQTTLRLGAVPQGQAVFLLVGPSSFRADFVGVADAYPTLLLGPINVAAPVLITLPAVSTVSYSASIENANGQKVGGCTVRFSARSLSDGFTGVQSYDRTGATTIVPDLFEVSLFPGEYDVLVTPPADSSYGVLRTTRTVTRPAGGNALNGPVLQLPARSEVTGSIVTFLGEPAENVEVRLAPFPDSRARTATRRSNVYGEFAVPVDPVEPYDIVFEPFSTTHFARQVVPAPALAERQDWVLTPPVERTGVVRKADGSPLEGALVTAYRVLHGAVDRSIVVGYGTTDARGAYTLLLAP